jgi:hypothetical protein
MYTSDNTPKRKYGVSYVKVGFISTSPECEPKPQRGVCSGAQANADMKPPELMHTAKPSTVKSRQNQLSSSSADLTKAATAEIVC